MTSEASQQRGLLALVETTAVVIPCYFPVESDVQRAADLLEDTALSCARELRRPEAVCLSVDGQGPAAEAAQALASRHGFGVCRSAVNQGKLGAVANGMRELLRQGRGAYLAIIDQDGDHFANELLNFVRAAQHVEACLSTDQVLVLGRRISRHRPMGYIRGELEELADRMLLDALQYDAARRGVPLNLQFCTTLEEFPDFHSGYKLFTRATAEKVFGTAFPTAGLADEAVYRHAVEAVLTVQALCGGATLVLVNRSTRYEQPLSTFGLLNRQRMTADKIIWPCRRLEIPGAFVGQWLDNHLPRLQLATLLPQGKEELLAIRRLVRSAFDLPDDRREDPIRPFFV